MTNTLLSTILVTFAAGSLAACTLDVDRGQGRDLGYPAPDGGSWPGETDAGTYPWPGEPDGGTDPWPGETDGGTDPWPGETDGGTDPWPGETDGGTDPWPGETDGGTDPWTDGGTGGVDCWQITSEAICIVTDGCNALYEGVDCRCYADGTCDCDSWQFSVCD